MPWSWLASRDVRSVFTAQILFTLIYKVMEKLEIYAESLAARLGVEKMVEIVCSLSDDEVMKIMAA